MNMLRGRIAILLLLCFAVASSYGAALATRTDDRCAMYYSRAQNGSVAWKCFGVCTAPVPYCGTGFYIDFDGVGHIFCGCSAEEGDEPTSTPLNWFYCYTDVYSVGSAFVMGDCHKDACTNACQTNPIDPQNNIWLPACLCP